MSKEAMKLALEALELCNGAQTAEGVVVYTGKEITALREALAEQPAQQDSTCNKTLLAQGKTYPRTCKKCGLGPCIADRVQPAPAAKPHEQEPVYHLRQYGDVTKDQLDRYMATGDINPQPAQLPFGVGGGLVAIKTLLSRDPCVHANTAIQMIDAILTEQPSQTDWEAVAADQALTIALLKAEQPAQQEPEWYHFVRYGEDCFVPYSGQAPEKATPLYTKEQL